MSEKRKFGLITLPEYGHGFYSNYFCVLSMIMDADKNNLIPYVNLDKTAFVENYNPYLGSSPPINGENTWNWWFDQEIPTESDIVENINYNLSNFSQSDKIWMRSDVSNAKMIINKYMKIKSHILKQADEYYDEYLKNHIVLGVMARGSEMNFWHPAYGNQTIEIWIRATEIVIEKHPEIDLIYIVTENSKYISIFSEKFPNILYSKNAFRRTTETSDYVNTYPLWPCIPPQPRKNHCRLLGEESLIQSLIASKCDYLLIKQSGTSTAAVLFAQENLKDVFYA